MPMTLQCSMQARALLIALGAQCQGCRVQVLCSLDLCEMICATLSFHTHRPRPPPPSPPVWHFPISLLFVLREPHGSSDVDGATAIRALHVSRCKVPRRDVTISRASNVQSHSQ